jgi:hypothetical protein
MLCPALFQRLDFRRSDNAKTAKREYGGSNRDARRHLLRPLVENRAHRIDGGRMFRDVRVSLEISFRNP